MLDPAVKSNPHVVQHRQLSEETDVLECPGYSHLGYQVGLFGHDGAILEGDVARGGLVVTSNKVEGSTAFNLITGHYEPTSGNVTFEDRSIVSKEPYLITQMGIARTFQNIRLFGPVSYTHLRA